MKAAKITLIVIVVITLIGFVRRDYHFDLVNILPFCSGYSPGKHDLVGVVMVGVTIAAARRLCR